MLRKRSLGCTCHGHWNMVDGARDHSVRPGPPTKPRRVGEHEHATQYRSLKKWSLKKG